MDFVTWQHAILWSILQFYIQNFLLTLFYEPYLKRGTCDSDRVAYMTVRVMSTKMYTQCFICNFHFSQPYYEN